MIEKNKVNGLPFVDGVPNPEERPDQTRVDWAKNCERATGAETAIGNEGTLNRAGVAIQKNVVQVHTDLKSVNSTVDELIDTVNTHSEIIGQTDNLDLIKTVQKHTDEIETLNFAVTQVSDHVDSMTEQVKTNTDNIGGVPAHDESGRNVRQELEWQKNEMGSYPGFDYNGMPDIDSEGTGMKLRIINNSMAISNHQGRINELETNWNMSDVGSLTKEVQNIRQEVGPRKDMVVGHNLYSRMKEAEKNLTGNDTDIEALNTHTGLASFPRPNANTLVTLVDLNETNIKLLDKRTETSEDKIVIIERQIGSESQSGSIIFNQKALTLKVDEIGNIVGKNNSEGLRYSVVVLEEELGADNTPGTVKNRIMLTEQGIRDLHISVDALNDALGIGSSSAGTFSERVQELELQMNGDAAGINDFEKKGVYKIAYDIFMASPIADVADSFQYVREKGGWVKLGEKDILLADGKSITGVNGNVIKSDGNVIKLGRDDARISLEGVVSEINTERLTIATMQHNGAFRYNNFVTSSIDADDKSVFSVGVVGSKVDLQGDILINGAPLGRGNVIDVPAGIPGLYVRVNGSWIRTDERTTPIKHMISQSYNVDGDVIPDSEFDVINIDDTAKVIKFGDVKAKTEIIGLSQIKSNAFEIVDDTSMTMKVDIGRINFGKTTYVNNSKVWTDAMDAPSDGEYYARRDGVWEKVDPTGTGTGSGVGEAPNDDNFYLRSKFKWTALGASDIKMDSAVALKWESSAPGNFTGLTYLKDSNELILGGAGAVLDLQGDLKTFVISSDSVINQRDGATVGSVISKDSDKNLFIGDSAVNKSIILRSKEAPKAQVGDKLVDLWTSEMEAPSDGKMYGRKDGVWSPFEVNRTLDVVLNHGFGYKVVDTKNKILTVATAGTDNLIELGQKDTLININSTIRRIELDNKVQVTAKDGSNSITLIGMNDSAIEIGAVNKSLKISASAMTINGEAVWTNAIDAPSDGAKYTRMNGKWEKAYTYGADAPNSVGAVEGDVYYQFM